MQGYMTTLVLGRGVRGFFISGFSGVISDFRRFISDFGEFISGFQPFIRDSAILSLK